MAFVGLLFGNRATGHSHSTFTLTLDGYFLCHVEVPRKDQAGQRAVSFVPGMGMGTKPETRVTTCCSHFL